MKTDLLNGRVNKVDVLKRQVIQPPQPEADEFERKLNFQLEDSGDDAIDMNDYIFLCYPAEPVNDGVLILRALDFPVLCLGKPSHSDFAETAGYDPTPNEEPTFISAVAALLEGAAPLLHLLFISEAPVPKHDDEDPDEDPNKGL